MMSEASIRFNYNKAIQQAKRLEELANQLNNLAKDNVASTLSDLSRNWNGDSASQFLSKGHKAQNDIVKTAKQLSETAAAIRRAAKRMRDAEERARQIALIRTANGSGMGSR